jgi:hypothetical protein
MVKPYQLTDSDTMLSQTVRVENGNSRITLQRYAHVIGDAQRRGFSQIEFCDLIWCQPKEMVPSSSQALETK